MAKQILKVALPDGGVGTRQSDHAYSHVVIAGPKSRELMAKEIQRSLDYFKRDNDLSEWQLGQVAKYEAALAQVLAGPEFVGEWVSVSWHRNAALAAKALTKFAEYTDRPELRVVEVAA